MNNSSRHSAATLLELIVVIGIISILFSLTISAVSKVRSSTSQLQCQNRLKQLVLSLQSFHDLHGHFPPSANGAKSEELPFVFWQARVLPFLEQQPVWENVLLANPKGTVNFFGSHPPRRLVLSDMACPIDDRMRTAWIVPSSGIADPIAHTSYLGNYGTSVQKPDGVLYFESKVRINDISDGTSNTFVIGERPPSPEMLFGWWYHGVGQLETGNLDSAIGSREINAIKGRRRYLACPRGPYRFQHGKIENDCDIFHFWSLHVGGANFGFGDGSVRFLKYSADEHLPALSTRAGGEVVSSID